MSKVIVYKNDTVTVNRTVIQVVTKGIQGPPGATGLGMPLGGNQHDMVVKTPSGTEWTDSPRPKTVIQPETDLGNLGAAVALAIGNGNKQRGVVNANVTITLPAPPTEGSAYIRLRLKNSGIGHSVTIVGASHIGSASPTFDDTDEAQNVLVFDGNPYGWVFSGSSVF